MDHTAHLLVSSHPSDRLDLPWQPEVILVAKHEEVTPAETESLVEVAGRAELFRVEREPHRERRPASEVLKEPDTIVGRAVIDHNELVGESRLSPEALEQVA
jgi:hypothetical protein